MVNLFQKVLKKLGLVTWASAPNHKYCQSIDECFQKSEEQHGWKSLPAQYLDGVKKSLENLQFPENLKKEHKILVNLMQDLKLVDGDILALGCGAGIYKKIFQQMGLRFNYSGVDICSDLINIAKSYFGDNGFYVADSRKLSFSSQSFDIVVLEGVLQHVKDFCTILQEGIRLTKKNLVIHRVTVTEEAPTTCFLRQISGQGIPEIHFNERELVNLLRQNNMHITWMGTYKTKWLDSPRGPLCTHFKTYNCERAKLAS